MNKSGRRMVKVRKKRKESLKAKVREQIAQAAIAKEARSRKRKKPNQN